MTAADDDKQAADRPAEAPGGPQPEAPGEAHVERVERDRAGRVIVHLAGREEPVVDAVVARCFPWSLPESYISVRDAKGAEVALLRTLDELDGDSREVVEAELRDKIFNPKIHRITDLRDEFGVVTVTAETDRGEVSFQIRSRDDVRVLSAGRALLRDVDGNTYELPAIDALDKASRKHFQQYF
jgi:hypothetical protein